MVWQPPGGGEKGTCTENRGSGLTEAENSYEGSGRTREGETISET